MLLFQYFIPSYNQAKNVNVDTRSWNADNNLSTIESYFIELSNYTSHVKTFKDGKGILYRLPYTDKKKYVIKPGLDSIYIAPDMSRTIIDDYKMFLATKDSSYYYRIIKYSNWLLDNSLQKDNFVIWPYPFKFTKYNLDYDWCGAWALGNILSAISRTIQLTADSQFISLGDKIVNTFTTKIEDGGILYIDEVNNYWFEEYPTIPPNHVLNGHINGILGLYDFWRVSKNKMAKELFDKGIKTVEQNLYKYDAGYWSYYDDEYPYVVDYYYHKAVHIPQLKVLFQITGKEIFNEYAEKWEKYFGEPYFSLFKLKMLYDGLHRRFTYKSFFTLGK